MYAQTADGEGHRDALQFGEIGFFSEEREA